MKKQSPSSLQFSRCFIIGITALLFFLPLPGHGQSPWFWNLSCGGQVSRDWQASSGIFYTEVAGDSDVTLQCVLGVVGNQVDEWVHLIVTDANQTVLYDGLFLKSTALSLAVPEGSGVLGFEVALQGAWLWSFDIVAPPPTGFNAPNAVTFPAVRLSSNQAVLTGEVGGVSNTSQNGYLAFEIINGETADVEKTVPVSTPPIDCSTTQVSAVVSGLDRDKTYYYRLTAANSAEFVSFGNLIELQGPPVVTDPADHITAGSATLHGKVGPSVSALTAIFEYGPTTSYGYQTPVSLSPGTNTCAVEYQLSNLLAGTQYHYRLKVEDNGHVYVGEDNVFTTLNPIVFIPGIAGSILEGGAPYRELWPTIRPFNIEQLALMGGPDNVRAVDVLRTFYVETGLGIETGVIQPIDVKDVYNKFLDRFAPQSTATGPYVLFDLARDPDRLNSSYMLTQALQNPQAPKPTFFPFPYDWRKSNTAHTGTLRQYIKRIKELHGGSDVDIITHSMGGLLMRRYFLDFPADASADVRKVVTIAAPFWGAPKGVYRMLTGNFYDEAAGGAADYINRTSMKVAYATLPAVHELLPSEAYFAANGGSVLREDGVDLNGNGFSHDLLFQSQYRYALDSQVRLWAWWIPLPSANNLSFHTSQQDSSLNDEANGIFVPTLHLYGSQPTAKTTLRTKARSKTLTTLFGYGPEITLKNSTVFEEDDFVEGDGTVPVLSAERTSDFRASGAALTKIIDSDQERVEHTGIMSNNRVWNIISNFLDRGIIPPSVVPTDENLTGLSVQSAPTPAALGRRKIIILGAGYVRIRDSLGHVNTQWSELAATKIPGVTVHYGGDEPWVNIECSADTELTIEGVAASNGIEMEVQQTDAGGGNSSLYRFRFSPLALSWKSSLSPAAAPTVQLDQNNSGTFEPNEAINPTHTVTGSTIDTIQPVVAMDLAQTSDQVSINLSATDNSGTAPSIQYSLDNGAIQNYSAPVVLPKDAMHRLQVFAEDAVGNTSGLIDTTINPKVDIGNGTTGITLQWPVAEAYVLEETTDLGGAWQVSDRLATRTGYTNSVTIPFDSTPRRFFRLRSQRTER